MRMLGLPTRQNRFYLRPNPIMHVKQQTDSATKSSWPTECDPLGEGGWLWLYYPTGRNCSLGQNHMTLLRACFLDKVLVGRVFLTFAKCRCLPTLRQMIVTALSQTPTTQSGLYYPSDIIHPCRLVGVGSWPHLTCWQQPPPTVGVVLHGSHLIPDNKHFRLSRVLFPGHCVATQGISVGLR